MGLDRNDDESDQSLWRRARAGDGEAFGVIFDRHGGAVFGQCRRRAESVADAEDLASMVFLEALRRAANVRFVEGSVRPWLLVVATNTARNHARARRRYRQMLTKLPDPGAETDFADEVVANLDALERAAALDAALASLRKAEQEVVALCDLGGLSYSAAAAALGVPVGTVRSRLSRARARLRRELGPGQPWISAEHEPGLSHRGSLPAVPHNLGGTR